MKDQTTTIGALIPAATYRLQFNSRLSFEQAAGLVDYLYDLGVSDCYASPLLTARPGSSHGYDITDHSKLNPEIGPEEEFAEFARRLTRRGMGLILDVVPNHMSIAGSSNRWWNDVLENGPSAPYAQFFDVDWRPPKSDMKLETTNTFLRSFAEFHAPVARAGMYNSLAQTLLKIAAPGVPDFYHGAELWDFNLVDPDNRRPVDFAKRRASLASLTTEDESDLTELVSRLIANPQDGRIKLYLTSHALRFRRDRQALFAEGDYLPLTARGQKESHVITLQGSWRLTFRGKEVFTAPRREVIRSFMLNHWYHHRGQLSVYLRLLEVPVPVIYGRSADENPFA